MTPSDTHDANETTLRRRIVVRGVVQGVGFRPFVWRLARELSLTGWVRNASDQVVIEVQGSFAKLDRFEMALSGSPLTAFPLPAAARVESIESQACEAILPGEVEFTIVTSEEQGVTRPVIPADLATCPACLAEIETPGERRFGYPFTNCTHCGPRWSIVEGLPYDRCRTSMASFPLCPDCRKEYEDPSDRRFHAQPIACPVCGPELRLIDTETGSTLAGRTEALQEALDAIRNGKIVALKGLGGFHLLVDATDESAVERLRHRKRRPDKPLAIMLPDLAAARHYCEVSEEEAALLASPAAPIVLLRKRTEDRGQRTESVSFSRRTTSDVFFTNFSKNLATNLAPHNPELGVMLPYTPLHHLIMAELGTAIVCTSGNLSEEPMATRTEEAIERLGSIADMILTHNRPIVRPVDDSVARCISTGVQILRRARGYAPASVSTSGLKSGAMFTTARSLDMSRRQGSTPVLMSNDLAVVDMAPSFGPAANILAVGGHLKNTVGLKLGDRLVIGSHIGDLETVESIEVHRRAVDDLVRFFDVTPELVACDLHPDYRSTHLAEELAERWSVPLVRVQHHHAHIAAVAAEHGLPTNGQTLGFAWDGTGFGPDGTVWGGEVLIDHGASFERFARLRPFPLPGGDRAIREPRRSALGLLYELGHYEAERRAADWFEPSEFGPLLKIVERQIHSPWTSSIGRLFDAVAMLCLSRPSISFEGQAAMELEFIADPNETGVYRFEIVEEDVKNVIKTGTEKSDAPPLSIDWRPMLGELLEDLDRGVEASIVSARFHNGLADVAARLAVRSGLHSVILSGGCFLNRRLIETVRAKLLDAGLNVYLPQQFPPGDGSISLGQLAVAASSTSVFSPKRI